jgi:hypothetical protein
LVKPSSYRFATSKVITAPLPFVYEWWTDYREDDHKITGQKRTVSILERTTHRVIMSIRYESHGQVMTAVKIVTLNPPNEWHLNWNGDEDDETGEYKLTRMGKNKTRLSATFKVHKKRPTAQTKSEFRKEVNAVWSKYMAALESDYRKKASRRGCIHPKAEDSDDPALDNRKLGRDR